MNCANHSDLPVSSYCQNCGKPLCTQCVRSVAGVVYCEPCLAARLQSGGAPPYSAGAPAPATGALWNRVQDPVAQTAQSVRIGPAPSPVLAGFLGVIPGVGAMYNGQFVKAFAHVIIFVILISITDHFDKAAILVAAWVFYQIFDAVQTAICRRDGRPLPDPFGLNDLGQRLGVPAAATQYAVPVTQVTPNPVTEAWAGSPEPVPGFTSGTTVPPNAPAGAEPDWNAYAHRVAAAHAQAATGVPFTPSEYNHGAPLPPVPPAAFYGGRPEPIGAIVLIGVGMLFLLSTLGVFRWDWVGRGWPVLIILIGLGLLFSRVRSIRRVGGGL